MPEADTPGSAPFDLIAFLANAPGRAAAALRDADWSAHPLGPPSGWPGALPMYVATVLENGLPMGIAWGQDLTLFYNDAFMVALDTVKHPAAMGRPVREVYPEAWGAIGAFFASALAGRGVALTDALVPIAEDGVVTDRYFTFSYAPVRDERARIAGVLITFTDTTARIVAERELRAALDEARVAREDLRGFFEQAPLPMCILTGPDHVFALANPSYNELVGRDVLGRSLREAFTAAEVGYYLPIIDAVYATSEPHVVRAAPLDLVDAAGQPRERRFIDVGYHPWRDARGATVGVLVIVQDVTESFTARRTAEEANRLKDDFLATMSHELRTPLNAILGWTTMLREGVVSPERQAHALEVLERNARSQLAIVEDVFDVARITAGKLRLELTPTALGPVVASALETVRPAAEAKGVALVVELAAHDAVVLGDAARLQQVAWNVLSNAVKFTPQGGTVTVRTRLDAGRAELVVADTGPGISREFLPHVFERFRQGDTGTTRAHGGLGLGLAIARHFVELHGGSIRAASDGPGQGTIFTVQLPVAPATPRV